MKSRRTRALEISAETKRRVYDRDGGRCIICGAPGLPEAHYISRAHSGRGIEQNIVTLCRKCHRDYDQTTSRKAYGALIETYLRGCYPNWDPAEIIYKK